MFIMTSFTGPVLIMLLVLFLVLLIDFVLRSKTLSLFACRLMLVCSFPVKVPSCNDPLVASPSFAFKQLRAPPAV